MRCKLLLRYNIRDLNPGDEKETLRAMPFSGNRGTTSRGFYRTEVGSKTNESAGGQMPRLHLGESTIFS
jgi:hypothetical protein